MNPNLVPVDFVNLNGETLDIDQMKVNARLRKQPKPRSAPAKYHKGWIVKGKPQGEEKLKKISGKPYGTYDAARQFKTLAENAGYTDVQVIELSRGEI